MDVAANDEKRGDESVAKKPRFDEGVNRVAEIVLVLSALRRIRGGKSPTELEMELMVEARSRLVEMCQEFSPKDIIGRDAIGAVIEDLGLNAKVKDQRLGFRAPKLTISEKLSLGKRKMEESKKHQIVSPPASNVAMAHQWTNNEMKGPAGGSHFAQPRPQFKPDMHNGASQGAGNYFGNSTTWSAQPHSSPSTISFGTPSDSKVPVQSSSRVTDPNFRPFMSQTPSGAFPGMKGVSYGQTSTPFGNNQHAEIAKLIQKVLQPRARQNIMWNPPSREYMTKTITCQMCQGGINEVDTLLICDACEKGYHLKCLQAQNMKSIPKSEWHCIRCVQLYNGKTFPPKYGRVMRSATTAKMSSSTGEDQSSAEKKIGKISLKVNQKAMPHPETAKPAEDTAMNQTVEAEDAAMNQTIEDEDAAMKQTAEDEDAAMKQTAEDEDAAMSDTAEDEDGAMKQTAEDEDAAMNATSEADEDAAMNETVKSEDAAMNETIETEDAAMNPTTEAGEVTNPTAEAEGEAMDGAVNANKSQGPIEKDAVCDEVSEPVSHSETLNPPRLENKEHLSKVVTEKSVSADGQDKDSKIIAEPSLQGENSASQTENSTADVQEPTQNNVLENPQED